VYKNIGGHTYGTTYSGPIGSVITPHLKGMSDFKHLSYASSLCGACTEACPVKINIHEMLLENRNIAVKENLNEFSENFGWKLWKRAMLSRTLMNSASAGIKGKIVNKLFSDSWVAERGKLDFPKKSFNQLWKERKS
jgi:L-lactate dehydrogenase complex protein LldF